MYQALRAGITRRLCFIQKNTNPLELGPDQFLTLERTLSWPPLTIPLPSLVTVESRLKNVIVFTLKERPLAVELGWIREVFTFGHVTPVPKAPAAIAGVVNFHGSIVSIIDIRGLPPYSERARATAGETGLLLEANRVRAALRIGSVDEVASLRPSDTKGHLIDSRERLVKLISPKELFASAARTTLPVWGSGE